MIHKALYGLKSSGLTWSQRIHDIILQLNFRPCKADPCVWLREMKDNMNTVLSEEPQKIIQDLKENSNSESKVIDHGNTILVVTTN